MQLKLRPVLLVIVALMVMTIIIGCIYEKQEPEQYTDETKANRHNNIIIDNPKKTEIETDKDGDTNQAVEPVSLGSFKLTAYCSCSLCCGKWANNRPLDENGNQIVYGSIGERLKEGYSVAVDPTIIPYQSKVIINDNVYEAQDCGGAIKGNRVDVYFENHDDALEFGVQYAEVFISTK